MLKESEYEGPVPCLLNPKIDCPQECKLHSLAKNSLIKLAQETENTPEAELKILRNADKDTTNEYVIYAYRKDFALALAREGKIQDCAHPEANILKLPNS